MNVVINDIPRGAYVGVWYGDARSSRRRIDFGSIEEGT